MAQPTIEDSTVPSKLEKPRRIFRLQFSLRTLLLGSIVSAFLFPQVAIEIREARRREAAISLLEAGETGFRAHDTLEKRRWVTSMVPQSQWSKWFPHSQVRGFSGCTLADRHGQPRANLLRALEEFDYCKFIRFSGGTVTAKDLNLYTKWNEVEDLEFEDCSLDKSAIEALSKCSKLKYLWFQSATNLDRGALSAVIAKMPLEYLGFENVSLVGDEVEWRVPKTVRSLGIDVGAFSKQEFASLLNDSAAKKLHVTGASSEVPSNASNQESSSLTIPSSIQSLRVEPDSFTDEDLRSVMASSHVKTLHIGFSARPRGDSSKSPIQWSSKTLERLYVFDATDEDIRRIGELPSLVEFGVFSFRNSLTPFRVLELKPMASLKQMEVQGKPVQAVLDSLDLFPNVTEIKISYAPVGTTFARLGCVSRLESMKVDSCTLTSDDCRVISELPSLRNIEFLSTPSRGPESGAIFMPLLSSSSLRRMYLSPLANDGSEVAFIETSIEKGLEVPDWMLRAKAAILASKNQADE